MHLRRDLGLFQSTSLVIGSIIGSGIFVSTASMAQALPNGWQLMAVWAFAGGMTALGALTQAELCGRMPVSGGLFVYFRTLLGDTVGFFYGWANFMIAGSGAIAAIAFVFATFAATFVPALSVGDPGLRLSIPWVGTLSPGADLGKKLLASLLILGLTLLNVRGVRLGARLQSVSTSAKTTALLLIVLGSAFYRQGSFSHLASPPSNGLGGGLSVWLLAMGGAFWAFDGWGNVAYIGDEVRDSTRILPRAILLGTVAVIGVYLLVNLAYFYVLPVEAIASAPDGRVASEVMRTLLGTPGMQIVAALIMLSTFDTVNSSILTNARVYYAMARSKLFWKRTAEVHPRYGTPHVSLWLQAGWSIFLVISGSFDLLTSMYVFVNWAFYLLIPVLLFLARRRGGARGGFVTPGYPWVPLLFAAFTAVYLVQTLVTDITAFEAGTIPMIKSVMGVLLVAAGLPFFLRLRAKR